jgi:hypothetical protein
VEGRDGYAGSLGYTGNKGGKGAPGNAGFTGLRVRFFVTLKSNIFAKHKFSGAQG